MVRREAYSTYRLINRSVEKGGTVDRLSEVFSALADPTRRAILARLAEGEATVNELAEPFPISLQAISKHLKVLERAGLITRGREAQWRPCRLDAAPLRESPSGPSSTAVLGRALRRLDEYLREPEGEQR